jgi:sulfoxide reductase catalytic subunit YedY
MVIPWLGFPLHRLLEVVEPLPEARFVRFESISDPDQMPGQRPGAYAESDGTGGMGGMGGAVENPYTWPYAEGLRLDEAMHDLTLLATGMYGQPLAPVNGAPIRVVVPWKYAFKSIKALTRIDLEAEQPRTFWNSAIPEEYGFYGNVNPDVPHPRWEQIKEVRYRGACPEPIVPTVMFNGYGDQVAHLYDGMDLRVHF